MQRVNIPHELGEVHVISDNEKRELENIQKVMAEFIDRYDEATSPENDMACLDMEELNSRMEPVMARVREAEATLSNILNVT